MKRRFKWVLKQLVPMTYVSNYSDLKGNKYVAAWKMWMGKVYRHRIWKVSEAVK